MIRDELTHKILCYAMDIYDALGPGASGVIYQRAFAVGLEKEKLSFARAQEQLIYYKGHEIGMFMVDFVVENAMMIKIETSEELEEGHIIRAKNYLAICDLPKGLLINFGLTLEHNLLSNPKYA